MGQKNLIAAYGKPKMSLYAASCIDSVCRPLVINQFWMYGHRLDTGKMKEALHRLLDVYPTLAGRMAAGGILCYNAGVLWEETDIPGLRVKEIPRSSIPGGKFSAWFDNKSALAGKSPLMSVKISHLQDGTILNVRCSHFCADGRAFYSMLENWAALAKDGRLAGRPVYDGAINQVLAASGLYGKLIASDKKSVCSILEQEGMFRIRSSAISRMMMQKLLRIDRHLSSPLFVSGQEIATASGRACNVEGRRAGRNAVLCAMAADLLKRRMGWKGKTVSIVHTVDHRGRMPGIGMDYMGNASFTIAPMTFSADLPFEEMAVRIDEGIKAALSPDIEERYFALYCAMVEKKLPYLPFDLSSVWRFHPTTFIVNNCLKFPIYGIDFGTGAPMFAWPLDFGDPVRFWPAPPEENGVYIYFTGCFA